MTCIATLSLCARLFIGLPLLTLNVPGTIYLHEESSIQDTGGSSSTTSDNDAHLIPGSEESALAPRERKSPTILPGSAVLADTSHRRVRRESLTRRTTMSLCSPVCCYLRRAQRCPPLWPSKASPCALPHNGTEPSLLHPVRRCRDPRQLRLRP